MRCGKLTRDLWHILKITDALEIYVILPEDQIGARRKLKDLLGNPRFMQLEKNKSTWYWDIDVNGGGWTLLDNTIITTLFQSFILPSSKISEGNQLNDVLIIWDQKTLAMAKILVEEVRKL